MKKNNLKNLLFSALVLALAFGIAFPASANEGSDKAKSMNFGQAKKMMQVQSDAARKIAKGDKQAQSDLIKIGDTAFNTAFRAAQNTFNKEMKNARNVYKQDKKVAHDALVASLKSAPGNQDVITKSFNVYRSSLVVALEKMFSAEQVAFNKFITTLKNLTITPAVNHAPVANAQSLKVLKNNSTVVALTGSDQDQNALTFILVTGPTHGTLTSAGATQKYTPNADFTGSDSFTFKVSDGSFESAVATVSIEVVN